MFLPTRPKSAAGTHKSPSPVLPDLSFDIPTIPSPAPTSRPKSFFGSGSILHKRTKSAGTAITQGNISFSSAAGIPLTPKALAHPPPPRVPPPTPATPLGGKPGNAKSDIPPVPTMGRPLNVAVAVGAALRREVNARRPSEDVLNQNKAGFDVDAAALPSAIPKRIRTQSLVPKNVQPASTPLPPPSPTKQAVNPLARSVRSPLRPVPGKENGYVKFKVKAIESKNGGGTAASAATVGKLGNTANATVAARGALKMRDRNVAANTVAARTKANPRATESLDLGKGKAPTGPIVQNENGASAEKVISPRRSLLKKSTSSFVLLLVFNGTNHGCTGSGNTDPSGALKKKANMQTAENDANLSPAPLPTNVNGNEKDKESRGRRALHAISRSIDCESIPFRRSWKPSR